MPLGLRAVLLGHEKQLRPSRTSAAELLTNPADRPNFTLGSDGACASYVAATG